MQQLKVAALNVLSIEHFTFQMLKLPNNEHYSDRVYTHLLLTTIKNNDFCNKTLHEGHDFLVKNVPTL